MIEDIVAALRSLMQQEEGPGHTWVAPYETGAPTPPHQFVLFVKPEATAFAAGVKVADLLGLIFQTLYEWKVRTSGCRVLRGDYLRRHHLMDQHYGVINRISHNGRKAITPSAEDKLRAAFAAELDAGAEVLGGHQFLERNPSFSPLALSVLSDNMGTTKLGGGTYVLNLQVLGRRFLILNPFHPYQLEPFYDPHATIIILDGRAAQPWADLRRKLAGATDPRNAAKGSIRNLLLEQQNALGLADVSQGANGIHLSAGPLEGMVEVQRFFSRHDEQVSLPHNEALFGRLLTEHGLDDAAIQRLAGNPVLTVDGNSVSAFDLTEEVNADAAADLLADALKASDRT